MKSKTGIIAIVGLLVVVAVALVFAAGILNPKEINQTTPINNSNTPSTSTVAALKVKATMTGPSTAKKGSNVVINGTVSNQGSVNIKNVLVHTQDNDKNLGTLNAGQSKTFTWNVYIPTDKEVQADFGPNATVSNPFYIGGFSVTFTDSSGSQHTIKSNSLNIKLS
ncbi:MAG: hypothetical protein HVN35_10725 [Methanobacteriaceae archaeon]|nr:hypothetical protein [Methanobacteriaceae archaeon]